MSALVAALESSQKRRRDHFQAPRASMLPASPSEDAVAPSTALYARTSGRSPDACRLETSKAQEAFQHLASRQGALLS